VRSGGHVDRHVLDRWFAGDAFGRIAVADLVPGHGKGTGGQLRRRFGIGDQRRRGNDSVDPLGGGHRHVQARHEVLHRSGRIEQPPDQGDRHGGGHQPQPLADGHDCCDQGGGTHRDDLQPVPGRLEAAAAALGGGDLGVQAGQLVQAPGDVPVAGDLGHALHRIGDVLADLPAQTGHPMRDRQIRARTQPGVRQACHQPGRCHQRHRP